MTWRFWVSVLQDWVWFDGFLFIFIPNSKQIQ
jgi:hypothetical protein